MSNIAAGHAGARSAEAPDEWLGAQRADYRTSYSWPLALNTPVIGAINGACVGLGFTTCLYQDIRIASENARMGLIFTQDRKSTRLNSSHTVISYAVFCLKKKKDTLPKALSTEDS